MLSLAFAVFAVFLRLGLAQSGSNNVPLPTVLHFFPRTSCNTGTSLSYTTVADLYSDSTCHTTPVATEALYIDGIADGCAVLTYSDSACSDSALLGQVPIGVGKCQFYGSGNSIGAWMGVCGAEANVANGSMPTSMTSDASTSTSSTLLTTMIPPANTSMRTTTSTVLWMIGNATVQTSEGLASQTRTPELQSTDVSTSGVASIGEEDWARRMTFKALLAMGSAEVIWAFVPA